VGPIREASGSHSLVTLIDNSNMASKVSAGRAASSDSKSTRSLGDVFRDVGVRETIESILVAVMLALLFKAFEAEAFVIPTGSMAPTLQGQHKDVTCPECGFSYRVNASAEARAPVSIKETTCPICRYSQRINAQKNPNQDTFSGDRILVSKFAYDIAEPDRWDVIVFRYPNNAKQNYIKRLAGLPGEDLLIESGNLYVWNPPADAPDALPGDRSEFTIVRKPPRKLLAMVQLVDDTHYLAPALVKVGWPLRWEEWSQPGEQQSWQADLSTGSPHYSIESSPEINWLRYRHLVPHRTEWSEISAGRLPERMENPQGELISDYYEYNDSIPGEVTPTLGPETPEAIAHRGIHWVGDLMLDANIQVDSPTGNLLLQCVEGGIKFTCTINVETGEAFVAADSDRIQFEKADGTATAPGDGVKGQTSLRGAGRYRVRFGNIDDQLYLWVNNQAIEFEQPLTYRREGPVLPQWSEADPGDAEPLGIGVQNLSLVVDRLRVWRDIYYIGYRGRWSPVNDYRNWTIPPNASTTFSGRAIREVVAREILESPPRWATPLAVDMFNSRNRTPFDSFRLKEDQFFVLGDNSPASSDARAWQDHHYVERENLVGKALFVYWPHTWWRPIPFFPNFKRMGFIR
jgi:signal peptidase I